MEHLSRVFSYKGLKLLVDPEMFNFSLESVLLANFILFKNRGNNILEIGTNNGIISLIMATNSSKFIYALEIEPQAVLLAKKNISFNNKELQIEVLEGDVRIYDFKGKKFDLIVCNPPFFDLSKRFNKTKNDLSKIARHEINLTLEQLIISVKKNINNKGYFCLTHRVERFKEVMDLLESHNFAVSRVQFIHSHFDKPAQTFLLEARYQSNTSLKIIRPLIIHNKNGTFREEIWSLYR